MKIISNINKADVNNLSKRNKMNNNPIQNYRLGFGNNYKEDSIELKEEKKNKGKEEELSDGLYQCILGRRIDLCSCPDFNGKDKNAAGKDHGFDRMFRCGVRSSRNL